MNETTTKPPTEKPQPAEKQSAPKRESIPVKQLKFREGIRWAVPGDSSQLGVSGVTAKDTLTIAFLPHWRCYEVTFTPRSGAAGSVQVERIPETWASWVPL